MKLLLVCLVLFIQFENIIARDYEVICPEGTTAAPGSFVCRYITHNNVEITDGYFTLFFMILLILKSYAEFRIFQIEFQDIL